ncbi:MAG: DUF1460 domain-containing protein [Bacteroidetes bacterium]|nr:DUF1460 domain-containing protein [Bacteroidota bacterium]
MNKNQSPFFFGILLLAACTLLSGNRFKPAASKVQTAEEDQSTRDSLIFLEKYQISAEENAMRDKTLAIARSFLSTPYVSGTLDIYPDERLVINLRQLDCWTMVENCLAISLTQRGGGNFQNYKQYVQQLRYWGGVIQGYGSRIHYFTGWVIQALQLGYLRDLTQSFGGEPFEKEINYLSLHADKYPKIRQQNAQKSIHMAEKRISAHHWFFVPKSKIRTMEYLIQEGDLVLLTSTKRGLDIAHEGFAVRINNRIHLLHASSLHKRVIISSLPLAEYMKDQKGQSGIIILRLND